MSETSGGTPKVFISYRRSESGGHAGRLYDAMVARFGEGNVFMDVDLQPGVDFVERISSAVAACHVLLVVMGPDWARPPAGEAQPRIADPDDFVRLEVATALRRSDVTVIPLLVEEAEMPDPDDLPDDLRALCRRNALELDDLRWRSDVERLLGVMETLLKDAPHAPSAEAPREAAAAAVPAALAGSPPPRALAKVTGWLRRHALLAVAAVAVAVAVAVLLAPDPDPDPDDAGQAQTAPEPGSGGSRRPEEVPADCADQGDTGFRRTMEAVRQWACVIDDTEKTFGSSLTYLEYTDAPRAHSAFTSAVAYERRNGWDACKGTALERFPPGEAACVVATAKALGYDKGTIELFWRGEGSRVLGHSTFDPPTKVPDALEAWSQQVFPRQD